MKISQDSPNNNIYYLQRHKKREAGYESGFSYNQVWQPALLLETLL